MTWRFEIRSFEDASKIWTKKDGTPKKKHGFFVDSNCTIKLTYDVTRREFHLSLGSPFIIYRPNEIEVRAPKHKRRAKLLRAINQSLPLGVQVYKSLLSYPNDPDWKISTKEGVFPFEDGFVIDNNGQVLSLNSREEEVMG